MWIRCESLRVRFEILPSRMRTSNQYRICSIDVPEQDWQLILPRKLFQRNMADSGKDYITNSSDPKNIQDLTQFVSARCFFIFILLFCLEIDLDISKHKFRPVCNISRYCSSSTPVWHFECLFLVMHSNSTSCILP